MRFEALARPEFDAIFRTVRRLVGRRAIAEEIVQETCLRAYTRFDADDEPAAFRPWFFRIAVNLALDHLRRGQREVSWGHDAAGPAHDMADGTLGGHPHVRAEGYEIGRALDHALAALSPELRAVAVLVLIEEMSYGEAAVALAISEDLVRSRLSRARNELRTDLASHGADLTPQATATPIPAPTQTAKRGPQR